MTAEKISLDIDIYLEVFFVPLHSKSHCVQRHLVCVKMGFNCTFMELK